MASELIPLVVDRKHLADDCAHRIHRDIGKKSFGQLTSHLIALFLSAAMFSKAK